FEIAHPRHLTASTKVTYTHVENELVQALVELGAPVALALLLCVVAAFVSLLRGTRRSTTELGACAASGALLLQSFGDFGLHFAGGFWLVALLATPVAAAPMESRWPGVFQGVYRTIRRWPLPA